MISDVLADATQHIRDYLDDPAFAQTYVGRLRVEIEGVLAEMERLREKLDRPPAQDA